MYTYILNSIIKLKNSSLQFQKNTEHSNFSNSVVDVFTQLTQCFEVLQKLECQDPEIWKRYMKRFAKTVVKVITAYSDLLKNDFPNHVKDEPTVIIYKHIDYKLYKYIYYMLYNV